MNKTSKSDKAVEIFNSGYNCAQAVLATYCEKFGLDMATAMKVSCGFGGGMGRLGETCGAVSGAYMLIGLKYGMATSDHPEAKEATYKLVQLFSKKFKERNNSTCCRDLLGVDLLTGDKEVISRQVKLVCSGMVSDAVEIIEEILELD